MKGAPAKAIQELAGHKDLTTTQRYMYLSPPALDAAIRLLDSPGVNVSRREIVETAECWIFEVTLSQRDSGLPTEALNRLDRPDFA